mgnify:CR=1 FL=1
MNIPLNSTHVLPWQDDAITGSTEPGSVARGAKRNNALSTEARVRLPDQTNGLLTTLPDASLSQRLGPEFFLKHTILPWQCVGGMTIIGTIDPGNLADILPELKAAYGQIVFKKLDRSVIEHHLTRLHSEPLSKKANIACPAEYSCRDWVGRGNHKRLAGFLFGLAVCAALFPATTLSLILLLILINLSATTFLRLVALKTRVQTLMARPDEPPLISNDDPTLPVVSVLVPLFREEQILHRLIDRLSRLEYPKHKLEICLVLEVSDKITRAAVNKIGLPDWFRVVLVPTSTVKTKPRAMNYALNFCRGTIIGIYDAEDAPDPLQIKHVTAHLAKADPSVACVQGYLDYYNARQNWLTRCFTIEYAGWFRVMLHGVDNLGLPVPLGGTSVFFRREALEALGGWDAFNVTEDADLGYRLARMGYRCEFVPTTTLEEASSTPVMWIKQRSRWLKGYAMTWITHMQHPVRLWHDLGPRGFFSFQVILLGTVSNFFLAPLVWSLWWVAFGGSLPYYDLIPAIIWKSTAAAFAFSELVLVAVTVYAVSGKQHRHLIPFVPTLLLYWPLGTLAVYKAVYELIRAPFYWDKTKHGHKTKKATTP